MGYGAEATRPPATPRPATRADTRVYLSCKRRRRASHTTACEDGECREDATRPRVVCIRSYVRRRRTRPPGGIEFTCRANTLLKRDLRHAQIISFRLTYVGMQTAPAGIPASTFRIRSHAYPHIAGVAAAGLPADGLHIMQNATMRTCSAAMPVRDHMDGAVAGNDCRAGSVAGPWPRSAQHARFDRSTRRAYAASIGRDPPHRRSSAALGCHRRGH